MKNDIKIFYHVLLENHWYTVVKEQLDKIKSSELLENVSEFYITLSSSEDIDIKEKNKRIQFFYDHFLNYVYPEDMFYGKKVEILNCNKLDFEYPTLEKAVEISKISKDFIGFYLHAKGVSKPDCENDHWRDGLNVGCIDHWLENVTMIKNGYDMSGANHFKVNKFNKEYKDYFCGNFFYFDSNFFSKIDYSLIDKSNRFYAESIYGIFYEPKCYNVGCVGMNTPFLKYNDSLRSKF